MKLKFEIAFRAYTFAVFVLSAGYVSAALAQTGGTVEWIEPKDGTRFNPGTNITLRADTGTNRLKPLEFLADGRVVGVVSNAPYDLVWSNVPAGSYRLKARVVAETGAAAESQSVRIRVYNALLTFGLDRVPALEYDRIFGIPLWQYCASLIYIFLAFYISKILDFLTRVWLKKLTARTKTQFDDLFLDLLNGPVKILAFVIFLRVGLEVFSWPEMVRNSLPKAFTVIVAISITYAVLKFIDLAMGYWKHRTAVEADRTFDEQLFPIVRKSLKLFVIVVAALVTLDNIGVNVTAAIASLSIGGLAIGLAAQDTLANLFGAVSVFVDKPFRVGDFIKLDAASGTVESIGLRSTRVRNPDGHLITIPNKTMGNATITNITRRPNIKTEMNFGLTYDLPAEKVRRAVKILEDIYRADPMTGDLMLSFNKFENSSLNVFVVHWWKGTDFKAYLAGMQELNLTIKDRFDAEGIGFAFPSQTLYVKQDSDWRLTENSDAAAADPAR
jgi:MscS family membrane protein